MVLTVILYTIMCYGLSSALVYYSGPWDIISRFRDKISSHRKLDELFGCMFCLPTNIGFLMAAVNLFAVPGVVFTPFNTIFECNTSMWPLIILFDGFYTGAIVSIMDTVVERIARNNDANEKKMLLD